MDQPRNVVSGIGADDRRLRLVDCAARRVEHEPGSTIGPRRQRELQMMLIHGGTMVVRVDARPPFSVPPGQMCLLLPGHTEVITFAEGAPTRQTLVRGTPIDLTRPMRQWLESVRPTRMLSAALTYISREAVASEQTRLTAHGALVDALATALLWRFVAEFENFPAALPEPIEAARMFIHTNLAGDIGLPEIAAAAGVTGPHLIRLFREHMDTTPTKYLWDRRVTLGVELLVSSGLSVGRVAERSGFATSFHFARKVKEATGQTPTQLRENAWSSAGPDQLDAPNEIDAHNHTAAGEGGRHPAG